MKFIFNTDPGVLPEVDLALPVDLLPWVAQWMAEERVRAVIHLPSADGWVSWDLPPVELLALTDGVAEAWITQRSGCSGLVTRLLLLDDDQDTIACIDTPRDPGTTEPLAWRVILLTALLAADVQRGDALGRCE